MVAIQSKVMVVLYYNFEEIKKYSIVRFESFNPLSPIRFKLAKSAIGDL